MKVVICGMGYVGATMAACLLKQGHSVVGIDVNADKAAMIAAGNSPVSEPQVEELLTRGVQEGRLAGHATIDGHLDDADMAVVCVGTPSLPSGGLDLAYVRQVAAEIGQAVRRRDRARGPIAVVFRSTMLPGSMTNVVAPILREAAGEAADAYTLSYNPEFLRESTAVADYFTPPKIVIGEAEKNASAALQRLYEGIEAPRHIVSFEIAELVKYMDNSFHALKVAFANEIGRYAKALGVDPQQASEIFVSDTKLNISPAYLRPGGAFGGSCLPKDVRALSQAMREAGVKAPVIDNLMNSNAAHKDFLFDRILAAAPRGSRVLLAGLTFKKDTDDLRESYLVDVAERLLGAGYDLRIYDPDMRPDVLIGANLSYAQAHLPHLGRLMVEDVREALEGADLVVIGKGVAGLDESMLKGRTVLNFHRL
jgi:GDP-mannose 6-dehydrogenase